VSRPKRDASVTKGKKSTEDSSPPSGEKKKREPDLLFDAIAEVTGTDPKASAGYVAKVRKALGEAEPPYTPEEVMEFGRRFKALCPYSAKEDRLPNLGEVEKYIGKLRAAKPKTVDPEDERLRRQTAKVLAEVKARELIPVAAPAGEEADDAPF
jgi:hypothetical protein